MANISNEVGVVTYPDGRSYALAVFTRARSYVRPHPGHTAAITQTARTLVDSLRAD